jgi:endonuclease YncB( thermonuclease family)
MYGGAKERVILYGLDCPEIGQPFGDQARKFTDDHCFKKTLRLDEKGKDKRGRTIAVVYLADGTNLNDELVRQGLA